MQSSTLTTGPKVLAGKIGLGLVKICSLEVRGAYKPFTGTCYTRHLILKALSLTPMAEVFILWSWIGIPKNERQRRDLLWYSLDGEVSLNDWLSDTTINWCWKQSYTLWILCDSCTPNSFSWRLDMHSDFRFALLRDQYKGSKCWAGSSINSLISRYINLKLTIISIVFVRHIDFHIHSISIYTKLSKTIAFEKSVLSIVTYGLYLTCVTSIAFTNHARHAHGLFAKKCNTMCPDMHIQHFKHRFIYTNNIPLIQILFKVNMRFFFLSVYITKQLKRNWLELCDVRILLQRSISKPCI